MTTRSPRLKKFAGMAVMATAVTAVGLGLGSGTAQASPQHHPPQPPSFTMNHQRLTMNHQGVDNFLDRIQAHLRIGEGTPFDNRVDALFGVT